MTAAAGGDAGAGIGSRLRAAREKKGLTILQAAEKMHVDSRFSRLSRRKTSPPSALLCTREAIYGITQTWSASEPRSWSSSIRARQARRRRSLT